MIRAVRFDRVYDQVALTRVRCACVVRDIIVGQVNSKIGLRLLDRLELGGNIKLCRKGVRISLPPGQTGYNQRRTGGCAVIK